MSLAVRIRTGEHALQMVCSGTSEAIEPYHSCIAQEPVDPSYQVSAAHLVVRIMMRTRAGSTSPRSPIYDERHPQTSPEAKL